MIQTNTVCACDTVAANFEAAERRVQAAEYDAQRAAKAVAEARTQGLTREALADLRAADRAAKRVLKEAQRDRAATPSRLLYECPVCDAVELDNTVEKLIALMKQRGAKTVGDLFK